MLIFSVQHNFPVTGSKDYVYIIINSSEPWGRPIRSKYWEQIQLGVFPCHIVFYRFYCLDCSVCPSVRYFLSFCLFTLFYLLFTLQCVPENYRPSVVSFLSFCFVWCFHGVVFRTAVHYLHCNVCLKIIVRLWCHFKVFVCLFVGTWCFCGVVFRTAVQAAAVRCGLCGFR